MKWFVYLFSLYILALSGFTCKAGSDCCKEEIVQQPGNDHSGDNHESHSACVPFLACGACNSILAPKLYAPLPFALIAAPKISFHYGEASWTNPPGSIWQPPQIA